MTKSVTPAISVVMPVYNAALYLRQALDSVLAQTFTDFEVVVIDDGSTDDSSAMLDDYARRDARVNVFHRENRGITATRNELITRCRGEFMAVFDSDDVCLPVRFERQLAHLRANPDVTCLGAAWELIDDHGRRLTKITPPLADADVQAVALKGHSPMCHSATIMRLDAVRRVGGYDPGLQQAEDLDLYLRLGELGRIENLPEILLQYRVHPASVSERKCVEQRACARRACEAAWARRGIEGTFEADVTWRPGEDRASRHAFALKYGWWAYNYGQNKTAVVYARKAIGALPWSSAGWKLLATAALRKTKDVK